VGKLDYRKSWREKIEIPECANELKYKMPKVN